MPTDTQNHTKPLLTVEEAAAYLNSTPRACRLGTLPSSSRALSPPSTELVHGRVRRPLKCSISSTPPVTLIWNGGQ